MSVQVEKLEKNMVRLVFTETAEDFEKAVQKAYEKNKNKIQISGFRKGHAPRYIIEKQYGESVFYDDAANDLMSDVYFKALSKDGECKDLEIVSEPTNVAIIEIGKGKEFKFSIEAALRPEVELGKYKGFDLKKKEAVLAEGELEKELKRVREMHSRTVTVEDRAVQDGDIAVIDYEGSKDGVPFEGGKDENHELVIGSYSFIDTFEEQLIGHNIGDEVEVNVTFPEEYHAEELKGAKALFKVKINGIKVKELPELDDEFASEISDFETFAEYKADVEKKLLERAEDQAKAEYRNEVLKKVVENAKMEIPDAMIETEARRMFNQQASQFQMQGLSMDMYLQYTGQTKEQAIDKMKEDAKMRIENSLVLEAIAKKENIEVTDEDVRKELLDMAKMYGIEEDKIEGMVSEDDKENIRKDLATKKAADLIAE